LETKEYFEFWKQKNILIWIQLCTLLIHVRHSPTHTQVLVAKGCRRLLRVRVYTDTRCRPYNDGCMYEKLCTRHAYGTDRHKHAYRQLLRVHVDTDTRFKLYDNECNKTVRTELTERNQSFLIVEKTFGRYKTSILVINWAFRRDKTRRFNTRGVVLISFRFLSYAARQ
jgi:hypothetical protein